MVAHGDTVTVRYRIEATHSGDLSGIPATGRPIRWDPASRRPRHRPSARQVT
jgi:predicted ester cyclase